MRLRSTLGRISHLTTNLNVDLLVFHISGELNSLADQLSRTVERNSMSIDRSVLKSVFGAFYFDLYGSALASYEPMVG